jgi:gelsolin
MPGQAKLEDSNVALIGGDDHKAAVIAASKNAPEWQGAGEEPGLQIWRIEKFKVKAWPKDAYGKFFDGDSYIVLHTYLVESKLVYDLYFWLGKDTTQDEMGTAAYKSVELDTLLKDLPVLHRECMGFESKSFVKLFGDKLTYLQGGVASGFNHVVPTSFDDYEPRLLHFKGKKPTRVVQVPLELASLNHGDVFLLDMGLTLIQWVGNQSGAWERRKAEEIAREIKGERRGRTQRTVLYGDDDDDVFWATLGGKGPIAEATPDKKVSKQDPVLYHLTDDSGSVQVSEVPCARSSVNSGDIMILDKGIQLVIWVGNGASRSEKHSAIQHATQVLSSQGRPLTIPIVRVLQSGDTKLFDKYVK